MQLPSEIKENATALWQVHYFVLKNDGIFKNDETFRLKMMALTAEMIGFSTEK